MTGPRAWRRLCPCLALAIVSAPLAVPDGGTLRTQDELRALIAEGDYARAEVAARTSLLKVEALDGADSIEAARVIDILVESLYRGGKARSPEARALAARAVAIKEAASPPNPTDLALSVNNLGNLLMILGDFNAARPAYERVLAIREQVLGSEDPEVAKSLNNLAILLRQTGHFAEARPLYERAIRIMEQARGPDHPDVARSLNSLAVFLDEIGDYEAARPLYERSLAIREKVLGPEHPLVAASLGNLAVLLRNSGEYAAARPLYERSVEILRNALGPQHPDVCTGLGNLAELLTLMGDFTEARPLYEQALFSRRLALGSEHPEVATLHFRIGDLLRESGNLPGARQSYERALGIWERTLESNHPDLALGMSGLASVLTREGDPAGARLLLERALAIREGTLGPDSPDTAQTLDDLATALARTAGLDEAKRAVERALAIRLRTLGPEHPLTAETLIHRGKLLARLGDEAAALEDATRAEEIASAHLRLTARVLPERQALRYASVRSSGLDLALSLATPDLDQGSLGRIWDGVIQSRAIVLDSMAERHRTANHRDPETMRTTDLLQRAQARFANLVVRGPAGMSGERYRSLLLEARREKEQIELSLAQRSADRSPDPAEDRTGISDVIGALPSDSALVAYSRFIREEFRPTEKSVAPASFYLAFIAPGPAEPVVVVPIGPAREIEELVSRWRHEVMRGATRSEKDVAALEAAYRETGALLRQRIWDPVAAHLENRTRVFVVPDAALNLVNLYALPAGDRGYLVESGPAFHNLTAERDLLRAARKRTGAGGLLAVGDPAFDAMPSTAASASRAVDVPGAAPVAPSAARDYRGPHSTCGDFQSERFRSLPASGSEVRRVVALWKKQEAQTAVLLTGGEATESAFRKNAAGGRALHIATHGFFLGDRCAASEVNARGIGGVTEDRPTESAGLFAESPLLLSGLALTGANHRDAVGPGEDDGILTAEEISSLDLSSVEWAVLSACDTGLGAIQKGEGVLGLRRSFELAGVGTLIMSLWAVEDQATQAWMSVLYEARFSRHLGTIDAVRTANLAILGRRRTRHESTHPFYWAAFVATGGWR